MKWTRRERLQHFAERILTWGYPRTCIEIRRDAWERKYLSRAPWLDTFGPLGRWNLRVAPLWTDKVLDQLERRSVYAPHV